MHWLCKHDLPDGFENISGAKTWSEAHSLVLRYASHETLSARPGAADGKCGWRGGGGSKDEVG